MTGTPSSGEPGIVLIGNFPPPFGGVPRHLSELAPFLTARGWHVHVLSPGLGISESHQGFSVTRENRGWIGRRVAPFSLLARQGASPSLAGLRAWRREMPTRTWLRALSLARLALQHVDPRRTQLVAGYNLLNGAPPAALLSSILNVPLVITNFGEIYSHRDAVLRHRAFVLRLARSAKLTSITRHCAESYRAVGVEVDVQVLPYGVDVARFRGTGRAAFRSRLGLAPDAPVAAFVGRLIPDMGLDSVLNSVPMIQQTIPDAALIIAGADGSLRPAAQGLATRSNGRVRVLVDVPEPDLPDLIGAADVIMCPTAGPRACGSLAAIEAMASGKPVVAARVGGVPEVVDEHCAVLVDPGNPAMLAHAVAELLRDPGRRSRMGSAGRDRASRLFDRERTNGAIESFFRVAIQSAQFTADREKGTS